MAKISGTRRKLQQLLTRYLDGTASDEEKRFVQWYYQSFDKEPDILAGKAPEERMIIADRIRRRVELKQGAPVYSIGKIIKPTLMTAAAVVLIFFSVYLFVDTKHVTQTNISYSPAIDKAILTAGDGSITSVDSLGAVLNESLLLGTAAPKSKYDYITIEVPKGCKNHFKLKDGTEVWLNPASRMEIPLDYGRNNRTVRLSGEAYFNVRHMEKLPFHVLTAGLDIKDIGTEFIVKAYPSQKTTVTLAKGSILVYDSANKKNFSLEDIGQQVLVDPARKLSKLIRVDTAFAVSMRNNLFYFDRAGIDQVLIEISQWYNLDFKLVGSFKDISFTGSIRRDSQLQDVLKILRLSNLNCVLDNGLLIITAAKSSGGALKD